MKELFLAFLAQHDDGAWLRAVERLESSIHPVDRAAIRIWLHFYPLALQQLMDRPDAADLARQMALAGRWRLAEQIDSSHAFLYAHRHWPTVKRMVLEYVEGPAPPSSLDLGAQIHELATRVAAAAGASVAEVIGTAAIGLRTLQHVGPAAFEQRSAHTGEAGSNRGLTADEVLARRTRTRRKGWRSLFGGQSRQSDVVFNERDAAARFPIIHSQHLTTAAALDTRDHRAADPRCSEGPIPVHCRSCSCGTCWIGVLGGAETLSPMDERERAKLAECGVVLDPADGKPIIRLACMTQAEGPVSIVIPPWNGLLGRVLTRIARETQPLR